MRGILIIRIKQMNKILLRENAFISRQYYLIADLYNYIVFTTLVEGFDVFTATILYLLKKIK